MGNILNPAAIRSDFHLGQGAYFLSHSVGRPLKSTQSVFQKAFLDPWIGEAENFPESQPENQKDVWTSWLQVIEDYRTSLRLLFHGSMEDFCPQVNLSSAVCKVVMSLDELRSPRSAVLMCEIDFPSMGFAMQKALPETCQLRLIPQNEDITDPEVWKRHLKFDVRLVFVSHAYSNTGQLAPWEQILSLTRPQGILTVLDVAQSAGVIPLNLTSQAPSFMVGSSVKWLCGGPGAAYLWVNPEVLSRCLPKDVGWFSHQDPFEMDIHHFQYHEKALRFWGGTPSIAPYAAAAASIRYFADLGIETVYEHNQSGIEKIIRHLGEAVVSPQKKSHRSGTCVLNFGPHQDKVLQVLRERQISVDARKNGIRVSPHIYNHSEDLDLLLSVLPNS